MTKIITYVHGDDESLYETGAQMGLTGESLWTFSHACDEFELELDVDMNTGIAKVISIDGRKVED